MKRIIILFCLINSTYIFGYKKTGLDLAIRGGYREDSIIIKSKFDMENMPIISFYDIKLENIKSIQTTVFANARFFGLSIMGTANYAWILPSNGVLTWPIMTGIDNFFPESNLEIKGHFFDYFSTIGYGIQLYGSRFILVPQIGYGEFNQKIKKPKISDEKTIPTNFGIFPAILYFQVDPSSKEFNTKWWGFHYGLDLIFDFKNNFEFEIGYFFHDMTYELNDGFLYFLTIDFMSFGGIIDQEVNTENISQNQHAFGHHVRGKLSYSFFNHWKIAAFGDFYYFKAHDGKIKSDEQKIRKIGLPSLESNELIGKSDDTRKSYSAALEFSYLF